ncbi:glycoside hydrolase family 32 protein [Spirosoma luteolum]
MIRVLSLAISAGLMTPALLAQRMPSDTLYQQAFRPFYHYSPRVNWINDPNGLVYFDSEYHLFYQHNPVGTQWGHMSWGHAISRDLVHWQELPVAIPEAPPVMIFSGTCVVDKANTSGFGQEGKPAMVALYTGAQPTNQSQYLAYSTDKGRTWTKYGNRPVIDLNKKDFRDPKVFWHEPTQRWVMVAALPLERKAIFFQSTNLKTWTRSGEFAGAEPGKAGAPAGGIWECPDLVEVPVDGTVERKWVLLLSVGSGAVAGGSGMQYYVGQFDGRTFVRDAKTPAARPLDWGKDYYAAITFNNMPIRGNRGAISLGWMNNWQYANEIPTRSFRGAMTLPRELRLSKNSATGYDLRQRPIQELKTLLGPAFQWAGFDPGALNQSLLASGFDAETYQLTIDLDATQSDAGVKLCQNKNHETVVGYDPVKQQVYVDRTRSGQVAFKSEFPGRFTAPVKPQNGRVSLQIWVDRSSVEVFANDGEATLTNQIFPAPDSRGIQFFGNALRAASIRPVETIWK